MKRYRIVNKFRFYLFLTTMIALISLISIYLMNSVMAYGEELTQVGRYEELKISRGDTLWNIALKYKPDDLDVRDMVYLIKDYNELDSSCLFEGDTIKIPIN